MMSVKVFVFSGVFRGLELKRGDCIYGRVKIGCLERFEFLGESGVWVEFEECISSVF